LGLDYLKAEPMLEYEEGKKRPPPEAAPGMRRGPRGPGAGGPPPVEVSGLSEKPEKPAEKPAEKPVETGAEAPAVDGAAGAAAAGAVMVPEFGMGMMGGMGPRRGPGGPTVPEVKYEPTAWGRYAKVLLSSSEFLFIN